MAEQHYNPDAPLRAPEGENLDKLPLGKGDTEVLYRIYLGKRVDAQIDFYRARIRENEFNSDFTFRSGAAILTFSALIATISASTTEQPWASILTLLAAVLPAFAAMIASFRQLYGWDKQETLYRESLLGLERVSLLAPDNDRVGQTDLAPIYPDLVQRSEEIFSSEINQWGQFVLNKDKPVAEGGQRGADALEQVVGSYKLTDSQMAAVRSVLAAATGVAASSLPMEPPLPALASSASAAAVDSAPPTPYTDAPAPMAAPAPLPLDTAAPTPGNLPAAMAAPPPMDMPADTAPAPIPDAAPTPPEDDDKALG